ncbi:Wzz/FepE/Etk N-terminal domain-containing protein [Pseudomonas sp. CAM1A]|uniref:Wzz/FepE/Etk N-terminal domain-containing protein n=1 Tax=Pseudomonas sp. CAM1A TaxID=3231717 RepID=UPI0039C63363
MHSDGFKVSRSGEDFDIALLLESVWERKFLVLSVFVFFMVCAGAYLLWRTPVYEARVYLQVPSQEDIFPLNYGRGGTGDLEPFKVEEVYQVYWQDLQSQSLRRWFFREHYLPELSAGERRKSQDELYAKMGEDLTFSLNAQNAQERDFIAVRATTPQQAVEWVSAIAESAGERARQHLVRDALAGAMFRGRNIAREIQLKRDNVRKQRLDEVAVLREALTVARSIGLEHSPVLSKSLSNDVSAEMNGSLVYMRGTRALEAEIKVLQERVSDDPFVPGLRQLEEQLAFFKGMKIDASGLKVYRIDGAIEVPDQPVKQRAPIILALAAALGLSMGVLLALLCKARELMLARRSGSLPG